MSNRSTSENSTQVEPTVGMSATPPAVEKGVAADIGERRPSAERRRSGVEANARTLVVDTDVVGGEDTPGVVSELPTGAGGNRRRALLIRRQKVH